MKTIYIFDMDGTLTPARKPMEKNFAAHFIPWLEEHESYLATGSDFAKVQEQLPSSVISRFAGIYASMGNERIEHGKKVYHCALEPEKDLLLHLENYRAKTQYPHALFPNFIEKRPGMINFSVLGRDCPYEERIKYATWDTEHQERKRIQAELSVLYPQYDFLLGGNISIDIVQHGCGKEQIAHDLRHKNPESPIVFFGDKTFQGGNDYALAEALSHMENTKTVQVNNPKELLTLLQAKKARKYYIVSGGFDPLHEGHLALINAGAAESDGVIVLVNSDAWLQRKKGNEFQSFFTRRALCESLKGVIAAFGFNDDDNSASDGIRLAREKYPQDILVFANGGDRGKDNIMETAVCEECAVELAFGVGGENKANSSSWILRKWETK